jgi:DNA-binding protein H-NS
VSDPPSLQHPLGIEAVHWSSGPGADLLVRVAGRWRRRRPATTVAPVLVIDTEHQRHRFPALAEPPSVRGAQAGLWVVCFVVPAALAPYLGGRLALMLGSVSISLPPAVVDPAEPMGAAATIPDDPGPIVITDQRDRRCEPADAEAANREARALLDCLELELTQARRETARLRAELDLAEGKRRQAEQLAHSEAAMRLDHGRDHDARIHRHREDARSVLELLQAVQIHARELASDVETLRRASDEAAAPPVAARPVALKQARHGGPGVRPRVLAAELALAHSTLVALRSPNVAPVARGEPGAHPGAPEHPRDSDLAGVVAPQRLEAALARLREERPEPEVDPGEQRHGEATTSGDAPSALPAAPAPPPPPPWLRNALRNLLREDAAIVGRLVIGLLPAQGLVASGTIRYDIAFSPGDCRAVTVSQGEVHLVAHREPRRLDEVDFRIEGDLAGLGRLLLYGSLRRRFSRRVARVLGERRALAALDGLVRVQVPLSALHAAGVRLAPELAFQLAAGMIDPAWTAGERFTIGHQSAGARGRVYLLVRDGERVRVSREPPLGPVASTIRSTDEELVAFLAGGPEIEVRGATQPVALLCAWIARAQRES